MRKYLKVQKYVKRVDPGVNGAPWNMDGVIWQQYRVWDASVSVESWQQAIAKIEGLEREA